MIRALCLPIILSVDILSMKKLGNGLIFFVEVCSRFKDLHFQNCLTIPIELAKMQLLDLFLLDGSKGPMCRVLLSWTLVLVFVTSPMMSQTPLPGSTLCLMQVPFFFSTFIHRQETLKIVQISINPKIKTNSMCEA